jgi:hypothetical protein
VVLLAGLVGCAAGQTDGAATNPIDDGTVVPATDQSCAPASQELVSWVVYRDPRLNTHTGRGVQVEAFTDQAGAWSVVGVEMTLVDREVGWMTEEGVVPYLANMALSSYQPRPILRPDEWALSDQAQAATERAASLAAECLGYTAAVTIPTYPGPADTLHFGMKDVTPVTLAWLSGGQAYVGDSVHFLADQTMVEMRTAAGTWYAVVARFQRSDGEVGYVGWLVDSPPDSLLLSSRDVLLTREAITDQTWPENVPAAAIAGFNQAVWHVTPDWVDLPPR